jgi:hypothetical protein
MRMDNIRRFLDELKMSVSKSKHYYENTIKEEENKGFTTVWFFEKAVIRARRLKKSVRIELKTEFSRDLELMNFLTPVKSDKSWSKAEYSEDIITKIIDNADQVYEKCYLDVPEPFGCCSKYLECSDKRRCIQKDKELARECIYKRHLEEGRIFYGKNRNIS